MLRCSGCEEYPPAIRRLPLEPSEPPCRLLATVETQGKWVDVGEPAEPLHTHLNAVENTVSLERYRGSPRNACVHPWPLWGTLWHWAGVGGTC